MSVSRKRFLTKFAWLAAVVLLVVSALPAAVAQRDPAARGTENFERWLKEEVHHQLALLPWFSVFENLEYTVKGSEVTLSGQVVQDRTKEEAADRVKNIEGVTKVTNNIEILPASPNDDRIRRAAFRAIYGDPALSIYAHGSILPIHIIVKNGHVTLEGVVMNEGHKQLVGMRVLGISGVFSVTNNLRLEPRESKAS
jgi:hyperosmotically inducible protein